MSAILKQVKNVLIYDQILDITPSGTIYKGKHTEGTPLLVKLVSKDRAIKDPNFLANFKKEGFIVQTIKSTNVFKFSELIETASSFYIVCHHTSGPCLEELINKEKPLNEPTILTYFMQILNGYSEFYKVNTPHLNLNPKTIHYDQADKTLKITPFYLPKSGQYKKNPKEVHSFMAPEFLDDPETSFNYSSDIWSLGAVLFFIAFQNAPIKGESKKEIFFNIGLLLKDVVSYVLKDDNRKFTKDFQNFIEGFLQKTPESRLTPNQMINHPCLVNQKETFEKYLINKVNEKYTFMKKSSGKYTTEEIKQIKSMVDNVDMLFKEKNLKFLETMDNEAGLACNYIRLYNNCWSVYEGNWIEKSSSSYLPIPNSANLNNKNNQFEKPKLIPRGATLGDIPIIDEETEEDLESVKNTPSKAQDYKTMKENKDEKARTMTKAKSMVPLFRAETFNINNFEMSEEEAQKSIIPKYYNEIDFYNFLYELFLEMKDLEKEFKEEILICRFSIIKYIVFRFQLLEKKVFDKANIFALPAWEHLITTKEYLKVMEIIPQKQEKQKWLTYYDDLSDEIEKYLDDLYKKGELGRFTPQEKHFLQRERLLHVVMFYANEFSDTLRSTLVKLMKKIRDKHEDLLKIQKKINPKAFKIGLVILKVLLINKLVGFDKFDKKMAFNFKEIRNSLSELKNEDIEKYFMQGSEGLFKFLTTAATGTKKD